MRRKGMECIQIRILTDSDSPSENLMVSQVINELSRIADYIEVSKPYPNRRGRGYRVYVTFCRRI